MIATRPTTRRFVVLVNGAAGSTEETDDERRTIADAFADEGIAADVRAVDPHLLPAAMHDAWTNGVDAIVVAGGDGSVNCAAGVAAEHDILLGVLPMGTFNHFAKDLGVPTDDLASAVRWLSTAVATPVDIGEVNGRAFVNNASIGVYPVMVADRESIRARRGWGKLRAAPVAIVRTLSRLPTHRVSLAVDGGAETTIDTAFVFIGNGLFDRHGNRLGHRTSLTDHRLGVYVIATTSRWRLVINACTSRIRGIAAADATDRVPAETLVVESADTDLPIALDGEPTDLRPPLRFRSRPGALRVLAHAQTRST